MPKGKTNNPKGRPKGTTKAVTSELRGELFNVYDKLGGAKGLLAWVNESKANKRLFYGYILPRVLPKENTQQGAGLVSIQLVMPHDPEPVQVAGEVLQDPSAVAKALEQARLLPENPSRWAEQEPIEAVDEPETATIPTGESVETGPDGL